MSKARLEQMYVENIRLPLKDRLGLKNIMAIPKIVKIVVNVGVKDAVSDSKNLQGVVSSIAAITGQKPIQTKAKKSIAAFKLREGMPIGVKVTLRGRLMYEFLDRLINLALPKIRDFQGVKSDFDKRGNYNLGIKEWVIFPELEDEVSQKLSGLNVTIVTTAKSDEHAKELLKSFSMPFQRS